MIKKYGIGIKNKKGIKIKKLIYCSISYELTDEKKIENDDDFDLDVLQTSYNKFSQRISQLKSYKSSENSDKISVILEFLTNQDLEMILGSALFLWDLIYRFKESISDFDTIKVLEKSFELLQVSYERKNFYLVVILLEILTMIGPHEVSFANIKIIASLLKDSQQEIVQSAAYLALLNMEYPGFYALCYILNREFTVFYFLIPLILF